MKTNEQLINNIIGQLEGLKKMIKEEKNCSEVLIQFKAVKSALNSMVLKYLEANALNCSKKNFTGENDFKKIIKEIVSIN